MAEKRNMIYIASPLGFSESGKCFLYDKIIPVFKKINYAVINPWKLADEAVIKSVIEMSPGAKKIKAWKNLNYEIGKTNEWAIRQSTGMFAVLDGQDVDSGTASEIGYAAALGKPILGYRGDFRQCGENEGSQINIQVEYFIHHHRGKIITEIKDLETELKEFFG